MKQNEQIFTHRKHYSIGSNMEMIEKIEIKKKIWTQDDFEKMGWHDSNIYGLTFEKCDDYWNADLLFDIDYIFKWIQPVPPAKTYSFWISPCTLIFKEVFDLQMEFDGSGVSLDLLEIDDINLISKIEQDKNKYIYEWSIELQKGQIKLKSYGFEQIVRQKPLHVGYQVLTMNERGGTSFSRKPF